MTGLWVLLGLALGLAALAGLLCAFAVFLRALAALLPPTAQLLGDLHTWRTWTEPPRGPAGAEPQSLNGSGYAGAGPERPGIAPGPVWHEPAVEASPTSAAIPSVPVGDLDRFEAWSGVGEEPGTPRASAPESKRAARPPGPPIEGEEDYGRRTE